MKVGLEEREQIRQDYLKFRSLGLTKTEARLKTAAKHDRGATTIFDNTFDLELPSKEEEADKPLNVAWPKTYIITGWEIRVGLEPKFIETLQVMAKEYDAELVLVPCQASDVTYIPQEIKDVFHILTKDIKFNDNLQFRYVETNALTQSPLAGHVGAYPDTSTILPGLIKELRTEPSNHYVKQLISTGSVGYLNARFSDYGDLDEDKEFTKKWRSVRTRRHGKGTAIAKNYIEPSALIVDVLDKKTFLTRFITSRGGGVVYDLNRKFTPKGKEFYEPSALVVGDTHAIYANETAVRATKDMIRFFNPKEVVLQDFFDGASINHHEIGNPVKNYRAPSLEEEKEITKRLLGEYCRLANKVVYLQSNHDNFLLHWLDGPTNQWRYNKNYPLACELQSYRLKTGKHPIVELLDLDSIKNLEFVSEKESHIVSGVLVKHGHEGSSGARTGFMQLAKIYNQYVQGHTHAAAVFRNAMCVGLTGELEMDYVVGVNAMIHANGLIHKDGSLQLLCIIRGEWVR